MIVSDTCPFCDSWNIRESFSDGVITYFCRGCGESWLDTDITNGDDIDIIENTDTIIYITDIDRQIEQAESKNDKK